MKNLFKIAFVAMLFVQNVKAQEAPEIKNPNVVETSSYFAKLNSRTDEVKMTVLLTKRDGDRSLLRLTIFDKNGNSLYSKFMNKNESQAKVDLNLEDLPDGIYTFEVSNKYGKSVKTYAKETEKQYIKYAKQLVALN